MEERRINHLGILERNERELGKSLNELRRSTKRTIEADSIILIEECLMQVTNTCPDLVESILEWEDLLDQDDQGEIILPQQGELGFWYNPDSTSLTERRVKINLVK